MAKTIRTSLVLALMAAWFVVRAAAAPDVFVMRSGAPGLRPEPMILAAAPRAAIARADTASPARDSVAVLAVTRAQLDAGVAAVVNGRPVFVTAPDRESNSFAAPAPGGGSFQVSVVSPAPLAPRNILLPVSVEDKALARGITLTLLTPLGNIAEIPVPPRRVFISIPFTIPVTPEVHQDFGAPGADRLIIQIVPRITKKAQVNIDNTADDGLVADIRYEGIAHLKLKDMLNRTNRRDMDGTFFIGSDVNDRWQIITENLFEQFDERIIGVARDKRLSNELMSHWRVDNVDNADDMIGGANFTYTKDKTRILLGNIDRRVKQRTHMELAYGTDDNFLLTRYEGLEVKNPSDRSPAGVRVDRFGYQFGIFAEKQQNYMSARLGNLRVEDLEDEGEIDDYFNFEAVFGAMFGDTRGRMRRTGFSLTGEAEVKVYGRGSSSWVQGELNINTMVMKDYLLSMRFNNDFARLTGRPRRDLWESIIVSFMRNRDYFNPDDPLGRWGFQSLFMDYKLTRERKGDAYLDSIRLGFARFVRIMKYDIPLEIYFETDKEGKYRPGAGLSIRDYF